MALSLHLYTGHGLGIQSPWPKSPNPTDNLPNLWQAWAQPGAMTSMINWYRAVIRHMPKLPDDPRIKVPTLMMRGMKDFALSPRMARPSMDYVDEGNLMLFPDATHWVHLDAAEEVNHYLIDFLFDRVSQIPIK